MGLRDRIKARLRGTDRHAPARVVTPPAWQGTPQAPAFRLDPTRVQPVEHADLAELLAALPRPLLLHHQASWDEASVAALPALREVIARHPGLTVRSLGWDRLREAPTGRIPGMAQRPARWSDGSELQAWHREHDLTWPTLFLTDPADTLRDAVPSDPFVLPRLELHPADGGPPLVHEGPLAGAGWQTLLTALSTASQA